ncbi:MAG TPA: thioredoxin peroxidase [Eubacteriaceae bacterium]|nr:thioredoxin peroxidase [Eubacteriaceae bacterium]
MTQLRQDHSLFKEKNTLVVAIGPENREDFAKYWEENDMPFTGIPDPEHKIAKLYEQKVNLLKLGRMPAQVLIDRQGNIRHVHYGNSMKDIPENEEILHLIEGL